MQAISTFLGIAKFPDFQWKNADIIRTQGVRHVIIYFLDLLWSRYKCAKFHHCRICVTDFQNRRGAFLTASHPCAAPKRPILNMVNKHISDNGISEICFEHILHYAKNLYEKILNTTDSRNANLLDALGRKLKIREAK